MSSAQADDPWWQAVPPANGHLFNPAALVRAVNLLHLLGPAEANRRLLDQARRVDDPSQPGEHGPLPLGRLLLICRLLWLPAPPRVAWPQLALGRADIPLPPADAVWPLSPLVECDGWPFLLNGGFKLGGALLPAAVTVERLQAQSIWRPKPLSPQGSALRAMDRLVNDPEWRNRVPEAWQTTTREMLAGQARRARELTEEGLGAGNLAG